MKSWGNSTTHQTCAPVHTVICSGRTQKTWRLCRYYEVALSSLSSLLTESLQRLRVHLPRWSRPKGRQRLYEYRSQLNNNVIKQITEDHPIEKLTDDATVIVFSSLTQPEYPVHRSFPVQGPTVRNLPSKKPTAPSSSIRRFRTLLFLPKSNERSWPYPSRAQYQPDRRRFHKRPSSRDLGSSVRSRPFFVLQKRR
jgi:hypothetical protein